MSYFVRNQDYAFGIDLSRYNVSADLKSWPSFDLIGQQLSDDFERTHYAQTNFLHLRKDRLI